MSKSRFDSLLNAPRVTRTRTATKPEIDGVEREVDTWAKAAREAESWKTAADVAREPLVAAIRETFVTNLLNGHVVQSYALVGKTGTARGTLKQLVRPKPVENEPLFREQGLLDGPTKLFTVDKIAVDAKGLLTMLVHAAESGKSAKELLEQAVETGAVGEALVPVNEIFVRTAQALGAIPSADDREGLATCVVNWCDQPTLSQKDFKASK